MSANNNSDYNKIRTKLYDLVPEVFKSDTNRAIFANLFDRYLTKQESNHAVGYVGKGNPNAIVSRQLEEPTLHRQTFQLQPILHSKVGSVEHMSSWEDLRNEYNRLGIDIERFDEWGKVLQFNWVPPVDIDKLINFDDYYWYDENNSASTAEYITIRSRCTTAIANANFWQRLVDEYGTDFPIVELMPVVDASLPEFTIVSVTTTIDEIIVDGDITSALSTSQYFNIENTISNDGIYQVATDPVYDVNTDKSTFTVTAGTIVATESGGKVTMRRYNRLRLSGEYYRLLEKGFTFYIRETPNSELNNAFWQSSGVEYDPVTNETIVTMSSYVTDGAQGGVISLQENLNFYLAERACQCDGGIGWDILLWDDNPSDPIWNGDLATLITSISNAGSPTIPGSDNDLWFDTTDDRLYQYNTVTGWKLLYSNFSLILNETEGFALWDYTEDCGLSTVVQSADQWTSTNSWLHKTDVPNFAKAKKAVMPILEFDWDLELNEWTVTNYNWKYRSEKSLTFTSTTSEPSIVELQPVDTWTISGGALVLDSKYGDVTNFFKPGTVFRSQNTTGLYEVSYSTYSRSVSTYPYQTSVYLTTVIPAGLIANDPLYPTRTSQGDPWKSYGDHWLLASQDNAIPTAHKTDNPFILPALTALTTSAPDYDYTLGYGSQVYTVTSITPVNTFTLDSSILPGSSLPLTEKAIVGQNDIRVYVNDLRQYGNYSEITTTVAGIDFVSGISFVLNEEPDRFDEVRIEVGEASIDEIGKYLVPVRTIEDNDAYAIAPVEYTSIIKYRRAEQVKTKPNQYPLFDIYGVDSSPTNEVSEIFGYATSPDAPVNFAVGQRTIQDSVNKNFDFDQFLIDQDNGALKAWRDYSNKGNNIWYDPLSHELFFFDNLSWSKKTDMGGHYREAIVSDSAPVGWEANIVDLYWVDTLNNVVVKYDGSSWVTVTNVDIRTSDSTLQSIWRKGLNDEQYVPAKVDWIQRTKEEYDTEANLFIVELSQELMVADSSLSQIEATAQATTAWLNSQSNPHSLTGNWIGDWEIPDPLYYNHLNENRKILNTQELLTHFTSIIDNQPRIPGYTGTGDSMFHLIPTNEVNYGLGGTIREYNDSYDTAFSSTFVNNVTPITLFEYARDQYESQLNNLEELFRKNAASYFIDTSTESLVYFTQVIADNIISQYELNDNASLVYGDSTTFTDVDGVNDTGVRNWIATLPYLKLIYATKPEKIVDPIFNLNQVIHHDGHRRNYEIEQAVIEELITTVISTPDDRTRFPGPQDPPIDTFGKASNNLPPNTDSEFAIEFNTTIFNRSGVYWHHTSATRVLYRLDAIIDDQAPISTLPDGTLWFDITPGSEVLREKVTSSTGLVTWDVVFGNTIGDGRLHNGTNPLDITTADKSAWSIIDLNEIVIDIIVEAETRLFENVPDAPQLRYNFENTKSSDPSLYNDLLEQSFLDFVTQSEIVGPYVNNTYAATDPFTWNYKYSVPGAGFTIINADEVNNTITIQGNQAAFFDPCQASAPGYASCPSQVEFFIKNSLSNDGKWLTKTSTVGNPVATVVGVAPNETTIIDVAGNVNAGSTGLLYTGILPSSQNNGSESGGDWKDYYTKLYNTPFPHLEPWKLQGYNDQPEWWEEEYGNNDTLKWGNRRWKYKHGFDVVDIIDNNLDGFYETFSIEGNFMELFPTGYTFFVDESSSNSGAYVVDSLNDSSDNPIIINSVVLGGVGTSSITLNDNVVTKMPVGMKFAITDSSGNIIQQYTVKTATFTGPPNNETIIVVEEIISNDTGFSGPADNATISGATYDSITNRLTIRTTTASLVNIIEGRLTIAVGMWEQIRVGNIKAGERYPNNVLSVTGIPGTDIATYGTQDPNMPTFNYFSVNIDNDAISSDGGTTNFEPDEVLPPYWDYVPQFGASVVPFDRAVRSVFFNFSTEIKNPSLDYLFGDAGPVEYNWRVSSQFLYDQLTVSYKMDPIRLVTHTFGIDFVELGGLQIDVRKEKVLSHNRTDFHGEIVNDAILQVAGTNQWYINFNRFTGFDVSLSDFRAMWVNWTAPLMYQMSSFVDTDSIDINHRSVPISDSDYAIVAKRSPAVEDYWNDAFNVSVLYIPPKLISHNTQADWKFEVNTLANRSRNIKYYDVHNYQFGVDTGTNICTIYNWDITNVSTFANSITVDNDQTKTFKAGLTIEIASSTGNNGTYVIASSVYDSFTNRTVVTVDGTIPSSVADGTVTVSYRSLPWITGDSVYLSTTQSLPLPLEGDNINGLFKYFIIVLDSQRFQLALTQQEAFDGINVSIADKGIGDSFIGQVLGTFTALNGERTDTIWRRYALDKTNVLSFSTPYAVTGVQNLVNIIHGYDVRNYDDGWRVNGENSETDFDTNRLVSWQVEVERFINTAYSLRTTREAINDRYAITVDPATDIWTFVDNNTFLITGDTVNILSDNTLPSPLIQGLRYYIIRDTFDTFRIATSKLNAINGVALDITSAGVGDLSILNARTITYAAPSIEINPMRTGIWFRPTRGIVSDVISGPTEDVRSQQLLFDQYSRPLTIDQIRVYREDLRTQISVSSGMVNDVELGTDTTNPYNNIHLGGAHLFVDTFEHVTIFNNYTSADSLIYDPFIGLNLNKIEYDIDRQPEFTQRPNMGGFYFETFFNQNASLRRNIEANIEDMRYAYDTYAVQESNSLVSESRKSLGYEGSTDYLDNLNLNDKSQFIFWRGMIQQKGSVNAVKAFINSRRFIDAKVDEFWAYKVADFGSSLEQEYPEIYVTTADSRSNDFRVEFLTINNTTPEPGFVGIEGIDEDRWYRQPDQVEILRDNGQNLYFDLSAQSMLELNNPAVSIVDITNGQQLIVDGASHGQWSVIGLPTDEDNQPVLRHNFAASAVTMTIQYYAKGYTTDVLGNGGTTYSTSPYVVDANSIRVFVDGVEQIIGIDWTEEVLPSGTFFGTTINLTSAVPVGKTISILFNNSTLRPGTHFEYINSDIIRLFSRELFPANDILFPEFDFIIWGLTLNESAQNPARLIDRSAETVLANIQVWDPARGDHYYQSLHNIQLQNSSDMAIYNKGTNSTPQEGPWGDSRVGTTWLDTFVLDYVPYYDEQAFPDVDDRLRLWGQLAGWGSAKIYEWVKSDVPPSEWDSIASVEEGDITIPEAIRKSGKARKVLFKNIGTPSVPIWVQHRDTIAVTELDAAVEGIDQGNGTYQFEVGAYIPTGTVINIYVNGILVEENVTVTQFMLVDASMSDAVHFHEVVDISAAAIEADATLIEDYQYSAFDWYDQLGNQRTDYYFWVENKGTIDKSTTRSLSIKTAEQQLVAIPSAYVVMQKVLQEQEMVTEPNTLLSREELYTATTGQTVFSVGLPIAPDTSIRVFVNGLEVASGDFVTNSQGITLVNPANNGDGINIEYTGLYDITSAVPIRFVQSIFRGLRGVVEADRRYTIRYTRDFTLRDDLQAGNTPLTLKDTHQEWKIFREKQLSHIDRYLWDKITEAMVGYKLNNPSIRVPSLNRELYDARYLTDTQFGIRNGQKFTDGQLAVQTVLADLQNPNNNFQPIDINVFFDMYSFDTPENIIIAMNIIYNTFPFDHVNRIFFSVLHDAFSFKDKYEDIFKTSMIALHGVRPFQVLGIFDD